MALALDASTPSAHTTGTSQTASQSLTSVPAGALIVAIGAHDTTGSDTTNTSVITDTASLSWTIAATLCKTTDPGTAQPGHIQVSWARYAAGGSPTVTTTGTNTLSNCCLQCLVFTGALASGTPLTTVKSSQGSSISIPLSPLQKRR